MDTNSSVQSDIRRDCVIRARVQTERFYAQMSEVIQHQHWKTRRV
jgi:hypothetical protein